MSTWDDHREVIISLYRGQKKTLAEVMTIMAVNHDFHATTKMYKSRLSAWNIFKNARRSRPSKTLVGAGSSTSLDSTDFSSLGSKSPESTSSELSHDDSTVGVDTVKKRSRHPHCLEEANACNPRASWLHSPRLQSGISTPMMLWLPEEVFRSLKHYYSGAVDNGTWITDPDNSFQKISSKAQGTNTQHHYTFYRQHLLAHKLIEERSFRAARKCLDQAFDALHLCFIAEHPCFLHYLFNTVYLLDKWGRTELTKLIFKHVVNLAHIHFKDQPQHPLKRLLHYLQQLSDDMRQRLVPLAWECAVESQAYVLGEDEIITSYSRMQLEQIYQPVGPCVEDTSILDLETPEDAYCEIPWQARKSMFETWLNGCDGRHLAEMPWLQEFQLKSQTNLNAVFADFHAPRPLATSEVIQLVYIPYSTQCEAQQSSEARASMQRKMVISKNLFKQGLDESSCSLHDFADVHIRDAVWIASLSLGAQPVNMLTYLNGLELSLQDCSVMVPPLLEDIANLRRRVAASML